MSLVDNFKRDIARHRGRSAILGVLFVTMIVFSIRAVVQLRPAPAAAAYIPAAQPSQNNPAKPAAGSDAQARLKESQELWAKLREVKPSAAGESVAFTFDSTLYPPPVGGLPKPAATQESLAIPKPAPQSFIESDAAKRARIQAEAQTKLVVQSTAVGDGISQPIAIINQKLLTVGQDILGFTLTAIRAREVEFVKEGQTAVVSMANSRD